MIAHAEPDGPGPAARDHRADHRRCPRSGPGPLDEFTRTIEVMAAALAKRAGRDPDDFAVAQRGRRHDRRDHGGHAGLARRQPTADMFEQIDAALAHLEAGCRSRDRAACATAGPGRHASHLRQTRRSHRPSLGQPALPRLRGMLRVQIPLADAVARLARQAARSPEEDSHASGHRRGHPGAAPDRRSPTPPSRRTGRCSTVTTAPSGYEGEGFPVRRAFAGVDLRRPRPVHPHGPDGRGGLRAGRAEGHLLAPAPRLRDRDLHHRRDLPAPGLQRRRRPDHQRRHPVDDRGRRHPAHRGAARGAGHQRRAVPRLPALGEPARPTEDDRARATRTSGPARSRCSARRTAARWSG